MEFSLDTDTLSFLCTTALEHIRSKANLEWHIQIAGAYKLECRYPQEA
jgi:hypothetical protein